MSASFDAFISYRRSDGTTAARRIRKKLQDYRPPAPLRDRARGRLKVYLDEIYERATNDFFERVTLPALNASTFLIVVATPDAVDRGPGKVDWIKREIAEFEAGPRRGNLTVVLARGAWESPLPGDLSVRYPNMEIIDLRGLGPLAFLVPTRAARHADELVKLVAPLLGLGNDDMPVLRREEEKRQQFRLGVAAGIVAAVLVAIAVMSVLAFTSRNRAVDALKRSTFSAERVIGVVADTMPVGEARTRLLMTGCDLLDSLRSRSGEEDDSASLVACATERASSRDQLGERDQAGRLIEAATGKVDRRFAASGRPEDGLALVGIRAASLDRTLGGAADPALVQAALNLFITNARKTVAALPNEPDPARLVAETLARAAAGLGEARRYTLAIAASEESVRMWETTADRDRSPTTLIEQAVMLASMSGLQRLSGSADAAAVSARRAREVLGRVQPNALRSEADRQRLLEVQALVGDVDPGPRSGNRPR